MINKFSILNGAKYFSSWIFQNYLAFIPDQKYTKYFNSTNQTYLYKSNRMSWENIENITKWSNASAPTFVNHDILPDINFNGHCLVINNIHIAKNIYSNICIYI